MPGPRSGAPPAAGRARPERAGGTGRGRGRGWGRPAEAAPSGGLRAPASSPERPPQAADGGALRPGTGGRLPRTPRVHPAAPRRPPDPRPPRGGAAARRSALRRCPGRPAGGAAVSGLGSGAAPGPRSASARAAQLCGTAGGVRSPAAPAPTARSPPGPGPPSPPPSVPHRCPRPLPARGPLSLCASLCAELPVPQRTTSALPYPNRHPPLQRSNTTVFLPVSRLKAKGSIRRSVGINPPHCSCSTNKRHK